MFFAITLLEWADPLYVVLYGSIIITFVLISISSHGGDGRQFCI